MSRRKRPRVLLYDDHSVWPLLEEHVNAPAAKFKVQAQGRCYIITFDYDVSGTYVRDPRPHRNPYLHLKLLNVDMVTDSKATRHALDTWVSSIADQGEYMIVILHPTLVHQQQMTAASSEKEDGKFKFPLFSGTSKTPLELARQKVADLEAKLRDRFKSRVFAFMHARDMNTLVQDIRNRVLQTFETRLAACQQNADDLDVSKRIGPLNLCPFIAAVDELGVLWRQFGYTEDAYRTYESLNKELSAVDTQKDIREASFKGGGLQAEYVPDVDRMTTLFTTNPERLDEIQESLLTGAPVDEMDIRIFIFIMQYRCCLSHRGREGPQTILQIFTVTWLPNLLKALAQRNVSKEALTMLELALQMSFASMLDQNEKQRQYNRQNKSGGGIDDGPRPADDLDVTVTGPLSPKASKANLKRPDPGASDAADAGSKDLLTANQLGTSTSSMTFLSSGIKANGKYDHSFHTLPAAQSACNLASLVEKETQGPASNPLHAKDDFNVTVTSADNVPLTMNALKMNRDTLQQIPTAASVLSTADPPCDSSRYDGSTMNKSMSIAYAELVGIARLTFIRLGGFFKYHLPSTVTEKSVGAFVEKDVSSFAFIPEVDERAPFKFKGIRSQADFEDYFIALTSHAIACNERCGRRHLKHGLEWDMAPCLASRGYFSHALQILQRQAEYYQKLGWDRLATAAKQFLFVCLGGMQRPEYTAQWATTALSIVADAIPQDEKKALWAQVKEKVHDAAACMPASFSLQPLFAFKKMHAAPGAERNQVKIDVSFRTCVPEKQRIESVWVTLSHLDRKKNLSFTASTEEGLDLVTTGSEADVLNCTLTANVTYPGVYGVSWVQVSVGGIEFSSQDALPLPFEYDGSEGEDDDCSSTYTSTHRTFNASYASAGALTALVAKVKTGQPKMSEASSPSSLIALTKTVRVEIPKPEVLLHLTLRRAVSAARAFSRRGSEPQAPDPHSPCSANGPSPTCASPDYSAVDSGPGSPNPDVVCTDHFFRRRREHVEARVELKAPLLPFPSAAELPETSIASDSVSHVLSEDDLCNSTGSPRGGVLPNVAPVPGMVAWLVLEVVDSRYPTVEGAEPYMPKTSSAEEAVVSDPTLRSCVVFPPAPDGGPACRDSSVSLQPTSLPHVFAVVPNSEHGNAADAAWPILVPLTTALCNKQLLVTFTHLLPPYGGGSNTPASSKLHYVSTSSVLDCTFKQPFKANSTAKMSEKTVFVQFTFENQLPYDIEISKLLVVPNSSVTRKRPQTAYMVGDSPMSKPSESPWLGKRRSQFGLPSAIERLGASEPATPAGAWSPRYADDAYTMIRKPRLANVVLRPDDLAAGSCCVKDTGSGNGTRYLNVEVHYRLPGSQYENVYLPPPVRWTPPQPAMIDVYVRLGGGYTEPLPLAKPVKFDIRVQLDCDQASPEPLLAWSLVCFYFSNWLIIGKCRKRISLSKDQPTTEFSVYMTPITVGNVSTPHVRLTEHEARVGKELDIPIRLHQSQAKVMVEKG